jgi:hypothetical protein
MPKQGNNQNIPSNSDKENICPTKNRGTLKFKVSPKNTFFFSMVRRQEEKRGRRKHRTSHLHVQSPRRVLHDPRHRPHSLRRSRGLFRAQVRPQHGPTAALSTAAAT